MITKRYELLSELQDARNDVVQYRGEVTTASDAMALIGVDAIEWRRVRKSLDDTRTYPWDSVQR